MSDKRTEPCFFMWDNKCNVCGHSGPIIYTPDLLKGPVECVCRSAQNAIRVNQRTVCPYKWSIACDEEGKDRIKYLLELAVRQEGLWNEIEINRKVLGYR